MGRGIGVCEIVEQTTMHEAITSANFAHEDMRRRRIEKRLGTPRERVGACEEQTDDIVPKDGQASDGGPDEQATAQSQELTVAQANAQADVQAAAQATTQAAAQYAAQYAYPHDYSSTQEAGKEAIAKRATNPLVKGATILVFDLFLNNPLIESEE